MKEYIKMIVVLTVIAAGCGFLLTAVKVGTEERIEEQILFHVKGPAVKQVLASATNDLIKDRQEITIDGEKYIVFIGQKDGEPYAFAFEQGGEGFGGEIGVMVGFALEKDNLTGIGITTHKETPGLGSKVAEVSFTKNFMDKEVLHLFKIKQDGGVIDAVTGATYSSRGVCEAVEKGKKLSPKIKEEILKK